MEHPNTHKPIKTLRWVQFNGGSHRKCRHCSVCVLVWETDRSIFPKIDLDKSYIPDYLCIQIIIIIYLLICACRLKYVGSTMPAARVQISEYPSCNKNLEVPLVQHFEDMNQSLETLLGLPWKVLKLKNNLQWIQENYFYKKGGLDLCLHIIIVMQNFCHCTLFFYC